MPSSRLQKAYPALVVAADRTGAADHSKAAAAAAGEQRLRHCCRRHRLNNNLINTASVGSSDATSYIICI